MCGARLEAAHHFCWRCGAERWQPEDKPGAVRPPPVPGTGPFAATPRSGAEPVSRALPWLTLLFGIGALYWLVYGTWVAAHLLAPSGPRQLLHDLAPGGMPAGTEPLFIAVTALSVTTMAILYSASYLGLRRRRRWRWVSAVIAAGLSVFYLVGIPLLILLLRRSTRRACGMG